MTVKVPGANEKISYPIRCTLDSLNTSEQPRTVMKGKYVFSNGKSVEAFKIEEVWAGDFSCTNMHGATMPAGKGVEMVTRIFSREVPNLKTLWNWGGPGLIFERIQTTLENGKKGEDSKFELKNF